MITEIIGIITKESKSEDCGILFYEDGNKVYILDINQSSPFASTELQNGMLVVSVNNISCDGKTADFVSGIISESDGTVTILANHDSDTMIPLNYGSTATPLIPTATISSSATPSEPDFNVSPNTPMVVQATVVPESVQAEVVPQTYNQNSTIATSATIVQTPGRGAPHGVAEGGVWGTCNAVGPQTCFVSVLGLIVFWPLFFIICCPFDKKKAYCVNRKVYDSNGRYLGKVGCVKFKPDY